jgi:hypothetical protein
MSTDFPIQDTPAVPAGAETPITNDDRSTSRKSTHGGTFNQDTLNFCRGTNVEGRAASLISPAANTREAATVSGMAVDSPVAPSVQQVGHLAIQGSSAPGDFRVHGDYAKGALDKASDNGGPRQPVGQAQLNSKLRAIDGN